MYKEKYIKYKTKYLELKNQLDSGPNIIQEGGSPPYFLPPLPSWPFGQKRGPSEVVISRGIDNQNNPSSNVPPYAPPVVPPFGAAEKATVEKAAEEAVVEEAVAAEKAAVEEAVAAEKAAVEEAVAAEKAAAEKAAAAEEAAKRAAKKAFVKRSLIRADATRRDNIELITALVINQVNRLLDDSIDVESALGKLPNLYTYIDNSPLIRKLDIDKSEIEEVKKTARKIIIDTFENPPDA